MLEVISLTKKYGNFEALKGINFKVSRGEIFAFLGPNGAGKTTTIKTITGVLTPDGGDAAINGISITRDPVAAKRNFGYLPDTPNLFEKLKGAEYLNFIMDVFEVPQNERKPRTEKHVEMFEMQGSLNSLIEGYSLGMKKKLGIISALCHRPPLLILDEPTSGLDPQSVKALKDVLKDYVSEGNSVFFSTHILEIAEKICSRVAIISQGRLVADGAISEIRNRMKSDDQRESLEDIFLKLTAKNGESV